jgi:hypothetical protein
LSPAFPGDSLIAVEITRTFERKAVVTPRAFGFEDDRASAARRPKAVASGIGRAIALLSLAQALVRTIG